MTFDWIDGKNIPKEGVKVWAEIGWESSVNDYHLCCYENSEWRILNVGTLHGGIVYRYFILPVKSEILDCLHCGGVATCLSEACPITHIIACKKCWIRTAKYKTEAEAIESWNRRV